MPLLRIDIAASYAAFQDAMTAIERSAKKTGSNLQDAFKGVNGVLAGLGVTVSVGALAALVKSSIDAADHINDLSKKTGVAVDVLGGIGFAAAQAGSSLDGVAGVIGKLNKSIAEAGSGNAEIGEAFKKLGVDVEDGSGSLKKADQILIELADKFPKYAEGPEKAALANRIFKKSYEEILPLLADGAESLRANIEYFQKYSGLTEDIARKSDAFNDSLEKMHLLSGAAGNQIAAELLPVLQLLVDKMVEVKESSDGFGSVGKGINTAIEAVSVLGVNTSYVFKQVGNEIGGIAAQLGALLSADPGGLDRDASGFSAISTIARMMREDAAAAREEVDRATAEILSPNKGQVASEVMDTLNPKPKKPTADRLSSGTDPAIARLAAELRELERMNQRERELLATRNEFLQEYYQQDLISINDYYSARKAAADEALAAQLTNIDKEVALLRGRRAKDANEATQNEAKIKELIERRADIQEKAGVDAIKLLNDQTKSAKDLQIALADINTELLEQQGHYGEAAARRFDERNKQLRQRLETELAEANSKVDAEGVTTVHGSRGLVALDKLRDISIAQGKLNEIQDEGQRIQSDLAISSERAALAAQRGSITELESLRQVSDARAQAAVDLKAVADAYADMAEKTGNPALIQRSKEMQVEVEKLAGSADLVRQKFEVVFEHGFESFFEKLMSGTASIKDALKSLLSDITGEFNKTIAHNLSQSLFGTEGSLGGVVDLVSQAFGGKPAATQASSGVASALAGTATNATASTALATLSASATSANAGLLALSASTPVLDAGLTTMAASVVVADTSISTMAASALVASAALEAAAASAGASGASEGAGGFIGLFTDMFDSTAAKGNIYNSGNLIPFANGGVPGIVDKPTLFAMSGGRTGLMGEAGTEAIMPLGRDKHGHLAVRMLNTHGADTFLPLARDAAGRLAVRAANDSIIHQKFAKGGVPGIRFPDARQFSMSTSAAMAVPMDTERRGGDTFITNVPQGTSQESASQIAARTAATVARASRRNN